MRSSAFSCMATNAPRRPHPASPSDCAGSWGAITTYRTGDFVRFANSLLIRSVLSAEGVPISKAPSGPTNVVALVGPDGALLIGTPSADSTERISSELANRTKSPVRYVVIAPQDPAQSEGDAGWGRRGAFVAIQEKALERIGGHVMGVAPPLSERFVKLGVDRPHVAFSEVLTFDLNGDAVHIVRQTPGYSDADALVQFHVAKLV